MTADIPEPDATAKSSRSPGLNENTPAPLAKSMSLQYDRQRVSDYYAEWAAAYDRDVGIDDDLYGVPGSVLTTLDAAAELVPRLSDLSITVLDAGCGTGRIAMGLASRGYTTIDGLDLTPKMVEVARSRQRPDGSPLYRNLQAGVDLSEPPDPQWAEHCDLCVVGGVFTIDHIEPESLYSIAELVKPGGVLITSVRPGYYDTTDYGPVSAAFTSSGRGDLLVEFESLPYTQDSDGRYFAYRIN